MMKYIATFIVITTVFLAAIAPHGEAALGCGDVVKYLNPCMLYITRNNTLGDCCNGVKGLYDAAATTADRQGVCNCLKSLASSYPGDAINRAAELPSLCDVSVPYTLSPSIDCSTVK